MYIAISAEHKELLANHKYAMILYAYSLGHKDALYPSCSSNNLATYTAIPSNYAAPRKLANRSNLTKLIIELRYG